MKVDTWWLTLGFNDAAHQRVEAAVPPGWSISHDWAYCGSADCRNIELHRDHPGDDHRACYRTIYGTYETIIVEVAELAEDVA